MSLFIPFFVLNAYYIQGKGLGPRSAIAKMLNDNPMEKDLLSGKLDSVAALRRHAKGLESKKRDNACQVSNLFYSIH